MQGHYGDEINPSCLLHHNSLEQRLTTWFGTDTRAKPTHNMLHVDISKNFGHTLCYYIGRKHQLQYDLLIHSMCAVQLETL